MLYESMKAEITKQFPSLEFTFDDEKKLISIPAKHEEVGNIEIQDDYDELTIFVGNFTHWHAGYYDENSANQDQIKEIVLEVAEYLNDMFNDKIFMWGSAMKSGGSEYIDEDFTTNKQGYVWSGPYHS